MPKDCDKSKGAEAVMKHYGWSMDEALCIGDDANDIEMIEHAGIGIAMGNAAQDVKNKAKFVTDSVDNDGFAKAMLKYKLIDSIKK